MCSIMGVSGKGVSYAAFKKGFDRTISRGPDRTRVVEGEFGILGFHRLAIMGLTDEGMQPFSLGENYLVCNGEIYGFRKLKEELAKTYTFRSGSDCEILLPMYEEYGLDMFRRLDAEFALLLYDAKGKSSSPHGTLLASVPCFTGKANPEIRYLQARLKIW